MFCLPALVLTCMVFVLCWYISFGCDGNVFWLLVFLNTAGIFKYRYTLALYIEAVAGATALLSTSLYVNLFLS